MDTVTPNWLAELAPPHAPPPPGWWPLAPGWWAIALLALITGAGVAYWQSRPVVRLRRVALHELDKLEATSSDNMALAHDLEHLLRRYAVTRFGRDAVAGLTGERWIAFVVAKGGSAWAGPAGIELLRAAYGAAADTQTHRKHWLNGARAFIKVRK